tara:strand:+ start:63 stop:368 length:306 start_codon:yes stop_codon:yes gene_type:complete
MIENFEIICGVSPQNNENLNFQVSDPNFVFENDPLFETIVLYDRDGNIVNVNSWIECAHYVNGGWDTVNYQNFGGDQVIFFGLVITFSIYIFLRRFLFSND